MSYLKEVEIQLRMKALTKYVNSKLRNHENVKDWYFNIESIIKHTCLTLTINYRSGWCSSHISDMEDGDIDILKREFDEYFFEMNFWYSLQQKLEEIYDNAPWWCNKHNVIKNKSREEIQQVINKLTNGDQSCDGLKKLFEIYNNDIDVIVDKIVDDFMRLYVGGHE